MRGLVQCDEVSRVFKEQVGPVALLVYDAGEASVVRVPGRGGWLGEALDAAEGRVLCSMALVCGSWGRDL